jgi:hypothetical protein
MYVATALTDAVAFTSRPPSDHSERFALGPYGVINLRRLSSDRGDQAVDVTICAVCQTITLVDDGTLHAPYAGVWVHSEGCSTRWSAASEPERINWAVRAIRWREES